MAINNVRIQIDGQWYTLEYNAATRYYEVTLIPNKFSGDEPGGVFNTTVEATNDTGVVATANGTDLTGLLLKVRETTPPILQLVSPELGYVTTEFPTIVVKAADNVGGSGIDTTSLIVTLDGIVVPQQDTEITLQEDGSYLISYTPSLALSQGTRLITFSISDRDSNVASIKLTYIIDTIPPVLTTKPSFIENIVDYDEVILSGIVTDETSNPVRLEILNNEVVVSNPTLSQDGVYEETISLNIGENNITVKAYDAAGLTTELHLYVIRMVTDRTQQDVDETNYKGTYNISDLNRVNTAMNFINSWLNEIGYLVNYVPCGPSTDQLVWIGNELGYDQPLNLYLTNITEFKGTFESILSSIDIPSTIDYFGYVEANNIEELFVAIDALKPLLKLTPFYSNEIFCGEV